MSNYDQEILKVLTEAGSAGISVQKISRHVFNACNSLFTPIDFQSVHDYVLQFLQRNSKSAASLIVRAETRGVYKLNLDNQEGQQLMLQFAEERASENEENKDNQSSIDLSLSLF
ncbi:MAG: hypothetical protein K6C10_06240 [Prevotella sp.]|nr:hypothetical protein [Prevotella sp.]